MARTTDMSVEFASTDWQTYSVYGSTLRAAAEAMEAWGAQRTGEWASTEWFPTYSTSGGHAAVSVATTVTMPQWEDYGSACAGAQAEWDRFHRALLEHEQGHLELVHQYFQHADAHLVHHDHAHQWHTVLHHLAEASAHYDHQTAHGQNHGTIIDTTIDERND